MESSSPGCGIEFLQGAFSPCSEKLHRSVAGDRLRFLPSKQLSSHQDKNQKQQTARPVNLSSVGGSTGWQAPEQLILRAGGEVRQGRSVDIFTFGLLLFYCLTGGQHAFGEAYERDYRILNVSSSRFFPPTI